MTTQLIDEATKAELVQENTQEEPTTQEEFKMLSDMLTEQVNLLGTATGIALYNAWAVWAKESGYSFQNATFRADKFADIVTRMSELLDALGNAKANHHVKKEFRVDVIGEEDVLEGCCVATAHKSMVWSTSSVGKDKDRKKACKRARENGTAYILQAIGNGTK